MIKTSICIYPSDKGKIDSSFNFTKEYCRVCLDVLPSDNHCITVICGNEKIFHPQVELDQLLKKDFNLGSKEKVDILSRSLLSLLSYKPNTFNVGRLMIVVDPNGMKIPELKNENLMQFANKKIKQPLMKYIEENTKDSINFDQLYLDLFFFSEELHTKDDSIDVISDDRLIHVAVIHPQNSEKYAQKLAHDHLKLSVLKMKKFCIYFLDLYEQKNIKVTKVKYQNPEDLVGPVEVTYPCVIINKDIPVIDELKISDIIFQTEDNDQIIQEWLLTRYNDSCFLSKVGPIFSEDVIQNFSFKADPNQNQLIQDMPSKLIISPIGDNWVFDRTKIPPAINCLTRLNQFDDKSFVLYSPHFINNPKARSMVEPLLEVVAKSSPSLADVESASNCLNELFNTLFRAPQEILQDVVVSKGIPTDQVEYAKSLYEKRINLIMEIKVILLWYENASDGHKLINQAFINLEKMFSQISYNQQ